MKNKTVGSCIYLSSALAGAAGLGGRGELMEKDGEPRGVDGNIHTNWLGPFTHDNYVSIVRTFLFFQPPERQIWQRCQSSDIADYNIYITTLRGSGDNSNS